MAAQLGRSPSTTGREISRNGGRSCQRAAEADARARQQASRPKSCKLASDPRLRDLAAQELLPDWSPEQIAGSNSSCIATVVERHSRFTMLAKLRGKDAPGSATALSRQSGKLPVGAGTLPASEMRKAMGGAVNDVDFEKHMQRLVAPQAARAPTRR